MIINRFETVLADTPTAKDIHYQVRYKVFCEETGFEEAARFPDAKEQDAFDADATHFIIWDRLEREWIGAMRLVSAAAQRLPCEAICGQPLRDLASRRRTAVEFSRLCVLAKHRKTERAFKFGLLARDGQQTGKETSAFFRQEENEIFLRLLRASFAWGRQHKIDHCYFIINRALTRLLKRFGIPLRVVGEAVEHRGMRTPQSYNVHEAEAGMRETLPGFARLLDNAAPFVTYSEFVGGLREAPGRAARVSPFPSEVVVGSPRFGPWEGHWTTARTETERVA